MARAFVFATAAALVLFAATFADGAPSFPLSSQASSSRFELVDQLALTSTPMTVAFNPSTSNIRYSTLNDLGILTTVSSLPAFKRYMFSDTWSSVCTVAAPPAVASVDIKYAIAALMVTGAATTQSGVVSVLTYANESSVRGISTTRWIAFGATVGANTSLCTLDLAWEFSNQWSLVPGGSPSQTQLVSFTAVGACGPQQINLLGSVIWFAAAVPNALLFQALGTCNASMPYVAAPPGSGVATPSPTTSSTSLYPMPSLPPVFSALIQATFAERSTTFSLYESYSGSYSRSTFLWPTSAKTVIVDGSSALAYVQSGSKGLNTAWADPTNADGTFSTRNFFSSSDSCRKTVFSYRLMNSVSDLLTTTLASAPRYMGTTMVRGIMTQYWRAVTAGQTYTWYFANSSWKFPTNSSSATSYAQLVRVTASGTGLSPFFVAHPYLQRWLPVPAGDATYCASIMDIAPDVCINAGQTFVHVYDFSTFVPRVDANEVAVPSSCTGDTSQVVAASDPCPATMSGGSIFLLFLISCIFGVVIGALLMYCRIKHHLAKAAAEPRPQHDDD